MLPLIFKRKKTAEYLRQNSSEQDDRKRHGAGAQPHHQPQRPRTLDPEGGLGGGGGGGGGYCLGTSSTYPFNHGGGSFDGETLGQGLRPGHGGSGGSGVGASGGSGSGSDVGVVGGAGYLGTGSCRYYQDPKSFYGVVQQQQQRGCRPLSPVGSGEWALRECEFHTTWLNELRKRLDQPPITDLRTAVSDGITLVQLTKALTQCEVSPVDESSLLSRPQALVNLDRCLACLASNGVDVIGVQASDLLEGDLKTILLLLAQIRRRYESLLERRVSGDEGRPTGSGVGTERVTVHPPLHPSPEMPGRLDTSSHNARAPHNTAEKPSPDMRRGQTLDDDRIIPGMMTSEDHGAGSSGLTHPLSDSDPRRHYGSTFGKPPPQYPQPHPAVAKPTPAPRPQQAGTVGVTSSERPPSQLGVAWAADSASKFRQTPDSTSGASGEPAISMEDRLRPLMIDSQRTIRPIQYDDGELLLLPPPPSRDFGDGVTLGGVSVNHALADGRLSADVLQAARDQGGYVPSTPSERRSGSRADTMLTVEVGGPQTEPFPPHGHSQAGAGQFINYAYVPDSQGSPTFSESQRSTNSVQKANLRSAWNKLYGSVAERRPPSHHDVTSSSATDGRASIGMDDIALRTHGLNNPHHGFDPAATHQNQRRHSQSASPYASSSHNHAHAPPHPRESPMGQSSSTQGGQTSDSSYRSSHSGHTALLDAFRPEDTGGNSWGRDKDVERELEELRTLGPASKYPHGSSDGSRPSSAVGGGVVGGGGGGGGGPRSASQAGKPFGLKDMFPSRPAGGGGGGGAQQYRPDPARISPRRDRPPSAAGNGRPPSRNPALAQDRKAAHGKQGRFHQASPLPRDPRRLNPAFSEDDVRGDRARGGPGGEPLGGGGGGVGVAGGVGGGGVGTNSFLDSSDRIDAADSIFDFSPSHRRPVFSESSSNQSVTPPLPPLSPSSSQPGSAPSTPTGAGSGGGGVLGPPHHHSKVSSKNLLSNGANNSSRVPFRPESNAASSQAMLSTSSPLVSRPRSQSALAVPRTPDLLVTSATPGLEGKQRAGGPGKEEGRSKHHDRGGGGGGGGGGDGGRGGREGGVRNLPVSAERGSKSHHSKGSSRAGDGRDQRGGGGGSCKYFARSRSLDDVRESGNESNDLSFDVETTMLTVAPSDVSEAGGERTTALPAREARSLRGQLDRMETMYQDVIKMVGGGETGGHGAVGKGGRRWSIASSDTSSLRKGRHIRGSASSSSPSGRPGKDLRSIQRRFQRLESHVVTLARSLAHLSSELRSHNALRRDVDVMKREVRELKQQGAVAPAAESPSSLMVPPFEKFRGWIPSLTNPKRINKLTQFFGQEPPLLEIFLKKLGYERYAKNFASEHIGMIELPYMTEDRLESIGIPMGPRLRILQESQLCFRQENFNIYIV